MCGVCGLICGPCPCSYGWMVHSPGTLSYPQKICIGIVFDFPWDILMSQENLQTMIMQNFWGVKEAYYGIVQILNRL